MHLKKVAQLEAGKEAATVVEAPDHFFCHVRVDEPGKHGLGIWNLGHWDKKDVVTSFVLSLPPNAKAGEIFRLPHVRSSRLKVDGHANNPAVTFFIEMDGDEPQEVKPAEEPQWQP